MLSPRFLGLAATLALVTACGDTPTAPQSSDLEPQAARSSASNENPVVLSASGGGRVTGPSGLEDLFTFNARRRADGEVTGRLKFTSEFFAPNQKQHGDVICMAPFQIAGIDGAVLGADFTSPNPEATGPFFLFFAIDGGEGSNAIPDRILPDFPPALAYPGGVPADAADSCESVQLPGFVLQFFAELDNGNIQVNP